MEKRKKVRILTALIVVAVFVMAMIGNHKNMNQSQMAINPDCVCI